MENEFESMIYINEICRSHRWTIDYFGDLDRQTLLYAKSVEISLTKKTGKIVFYTIPEVLNDIQKVMKWNEGNQDIIIRTTDGMAKTLNSVAFAAYDINHYTKLDYTDTDILLQIFTFKIRYARFD